MATLKVLLEMFATIIIPTWNRCCALARTLQSVSELDFPSNSYEVIVVDNVSIDQTFAAFEVASKHASSRNWRYLSEATPGLLSGRHKGALESCGDVCAFIDDDVRVERTWLSALQDAFKDPAVALVGGPSTPLFEADPPDWLAEFYSEGEHGRSCGYLSLIDGGERAKEIHPCFVWGLNFAIRRKILFDLGGFHPDCVPRLLQRFQGDGETGLSLKLGAAGLKAFYHPKASVRHEVPKSRLNVQYFEQRAFYQGVADSYTRIRAEGMVDRSWKISLRRSSEYLARSIGRRNSPQGEIVCRTKRSYTDGYHFHHTEVSRDSKLLAWVLRNDYWDYRLPEGWEDHLSRARRKAREHAERLRRPRRDATWL